MIVAKTECYLCNDEIELDDDYGWTEADNGRRAIFCDNCFDKEFKDNEELVVPAHGVVKISAAILTGIPSSTYFKMVSPSIKDLINHGVIEGKKVSSVEPASTKETEDAKSWDDKKKK